MKKLVSILAAALFALSMAAPAMAYFDNGDLIQIVYNTAGGTEVATDLGSISGSTFTSNGNSLSFLGGGTITGTGSSASISGGTTFSGVKLSNLNVTYLAYNNNDGLAPIYFSSASATAPTVVDGTAWPSASLSLQVLYQAAGTQQVLGSTSNPSSYSSTLTQGGAAQGTVGGLFASNITEATLTALASGNAITQKLYYFADTTGTATATDLALNITTNTNGTVTVAGATPTPIPPSFLLMGSGLLGMVGIRRKFTA